MEVKNDYKIGRWLQKAGDGELCLPAFQRKEVWKPTMIRKFIETVILDVLSPLGVFLVLEILATKPIFSPRRIDGKIGKSDQCHLLLLDGQQRLKALWTALSDSEKSYRYYARFDDYFEVVEIKMVRRSKGNDALHKNPNRQFAKGLFPLRLLNPLDGNTQISKWLSALEADADDRAAIKKLIADTRKLFAKTADSGRVIPYFKLSYKDLDEGKAVEIYKTINTNSVKLTKYYLAVAEMERKTRKSLYDIADELAKEAPEIQDLESDELGELILKVFCLMEGKIPSGGNYLNLPFKKLITKKGGIIAGVKWAVQKLEHLGIWHARQLPSVVPLRVLPALHARLPNGAAAKAKVNNLVEKYLWHAFLTDRYSNQVNQRLKEDYDGMLAFLSDKGKEKDITIFNRGPRTHDAPTKERLMKVGWPSAGAKNIWARGVLLVCCRGGAKALANDEVLSKDNYLERELHHIYPKSILPSGPDVDSNVALNCMLIPSDDNKKYGNDYPGEYIKKLFDELGSELPQVDVVERLETHLIPKGPATVLVRITKDSADDLKNSYEEFLDQRAKLVFGEITKLLEN